MSVFLLSGRGLCVGLRSPAVSECDLETSVTRGPGPTRAVVPLGLEGWGCIVEISNSQM